MILTPPPPHRLHVGARVMIGGGLVFSEPPPPPTYAPCGCCSCDPGVPAYYAPPPPPQPIAAPPAEVPVVVAPPPRPLARFGLGLFVGSVSLEDEQQGDDFGLLARYRLTPGWAIEAELGKTKMQESGTEERRVGAGILFDFAGRATLSPYLVAAAGSWDGRRYAEGGAGLTYRLTPNVHLAADLRAGVHCESCAEDSTPVNEAGVTATAAPEDDLNGSRYARARLSAIVHF